MNTRQQIVSAIEAAKEELEQALVTLRRLPAFDAGTFRYVAHMLGNYLNITRGACAPLRGPALAAPGDDEAPVFLQPREPPTDLRASLARPLIPASAAHEVPLVAERVDLSRLGRLACAYYQMLAANKRIQI